MSVELTADAANYQQPAWKSAISTASAVLMAIVFFAAGVWKLTDPFTWSQVLGQFRVPSNLDMPLTLLVGIGDTVAAVLLIVPSFRRWGGILASLLLVGYMGYFAINYSALAGKECSCFPLVKRTIGPGFFIGDTVMLALSIAAAAWSQRSSRLRGALAALGAVIVFAGISYGINAKEHSGIAAPTPVMVDGKPYAIDQGHVFLFFYDPSCPFCDAAARRMSKYQWKDTTVIALPTENPQWAASFLHDTGLKALTSTDTEKLRRVFKFINVPYGVALDGGREKAVVQNFDASEPARTLRPLGYVQ